MQNIEDEFIVLTATSEEELSREMMYRKEEMTLLLVKKILWALNNNRDVFIYAYLQMDDERKAVGVKREDFLEALFKNVERLEEYEEYELCVEVRKWIDYLKIERDVKR